MQIEETRLPGLLVLTPPRFGDARGHFSETWNRETLRGRGIDVDFVQDNQSLSREVGVVRGLHCQAPPQAQDKLVRVGRGFAWLDTGTHESLLDASNFVRTLQSRQAMQTGCLEEIAFDQGWIDRAALAEVAEAMGKSVYGRYLRDLLDEADGAPAGSA